MSVVNNPNWLTSKETTTWLTDVDFPYTTVEHMIQYIRIKWPLAFQSIVLQDNEMPQSYAHWWCHCRAQYRKTKEALPKYTRLVTLEEQYGKTHTEILSDFLVWLDMLFVDISMLKDEIHHEGVPRLYGNEILFQKGDPTNRRSRRDTVKFIVHTGTEIFEERGFIEGLQWWNKQCERVISL